MRRLEAPVRRRVSAAVDRLAYSRRGDVQRVRGVTGEWRLRVGDWRVFLNFDGREKRILILRIRHRREAYR